METITLLFTLRVLVVFNPLILLLLRGVTNAKGTRETRDHEFEKCDCIIDDNEITSDARTTMQMASVQGNTAFNVSIFQP